ncbi:MAG: hypothetical protein M1389_12990 [Chloroflexi bacterium]|nr:hypothetical protein [Chloroflexota bacterium]
MDMPLPDEFEAPVWTWALRHGLPQPAICQATKKARLSSVERFLGCLLRENIGDALASCTFWDPPTVLSQQLRQTSLPDATIHRPTSTIVAWQLTSGITILIPLASAFSLHRYQFSGFPLKLENQSWQEIGNPSDLLRVLTDAGFPAQASGDWHRLAADLLHSNASLLLARLQRAIRRSHPEGLDLLDVQSSCADRTIIQFEQRALEGHLLHPTPKARPGLRIDDELKYAPEGRSRYRLNLAAIPRHLAVSLPLRPDIDPHCWMAPPIHDYASDMLAQRGLRADDFYIVPLHPLQVAHLQQRGAFSTDGQDILLLGDKGPLATPLLSFRTVYVEDTSLYLKLALNMTLTSAPRTLSIRPRHNSIVLARILDRIAMTGDIPPTFTFQRELLSVGAEDGHPHYKDFGVIVREACAPILGDAHQVAMPAACLFEESPQEKDQLIIDDLLSEYARCHTAIRDYHIDFFSRYIHLLVPPAVMLLTKYGIGLEAHLQNSVVAFHQGAPVRMVYRDYDAVSICLDRLRWFLCSDTAFYPGSWNVARDCFAAQDKLRHSLLHSHVAEMICHICAMYGAPEPHLWAMVADLIHQTLDAVVPGDPSRKTAVAEDHAFFFAKWTQLKALAKMKLAHQDNQYIYTVAANPLSLAGEPSHEA